MACMDIAISTPGAPLAGARRLACPARGGPTRTQLTMKQRDRDRQVRLQISREMRHGREQVTAVYLGR
jgi:hypothetical protein